MITDIYFIYSTKEEKARFGDALGEINFSNTSPFLHFISSQSKEGKKEAYKIKSHFAAKLDPFIIVYNKDKPIRGFYSEAGDCIEQFIKWLKYDTSLE